MIKSMMIGFCFFMLPGVMGVVKCLQGYSKNLWMDI